MKSNKRPIKILTGSVLLSTAAVSLQAQQKEEIPQHPNVIYFLCDDLGFSDIEAYGNQFISTPNINNLVNKGISFTQNYAGSTVSAPSRATLLTGQHTGHTRIRGNKEVSPEGQWPIDPNVKTIAQVFKTAGYTTGVFGKWGLGYPGSEATPDKVGFDTFFGYNCQAQAHSYYPKWLYRNNEKITMDGATYSADVIHKEAIKFIQDNKDKPFFGYFAYTLPHASLEQPDDSILQKYKGKFCERPFNYNGGYSGTPIPRAQFAGMVTRLDAYVGEIIAELEKQGIAENTIFIFTSDNGPHREGGADPNFFNSEKWMVGLKRDLYEGGIRVPMIVTWPKVIKSASISHHITAQWDIMPTFTELVGLKDTWTQPTDGISILPTLTGQGTQQNHEYLYWEFHEMGGRQAVRKGSWKLIRQHIKTSPTLELYNLDNDLYEEHNVIKDYPEIAKELEELMDNAHTPSTLFNFGR